MLREELFYFTLGVWLCSSLKRLYTLYCTFGEVSSYEAIPNTCVEKSHRDCTLGRNECTNQWSCYELFCSQKGSRPRQCTLAMMYPWIEHERLHRNGWSNIPFWRLNEEGANSQLSEINISVICTIKRPQKFIWDRQNHNNKLLRSDGSSQDLDYLVTYLKYSRSEGDKNI